jgi:hypothetical protein
MRLHANGLAHRLTGLLVLLLLCATALPPTLHGEMDDLACEFGVGADTGAPALDNGGASGKAAHCEVCHWLQSLRVCQLPDHRLPQPLAAVADVAPATSPEVAAPGLPRRPSRAPPLS